ncbi:MAG: outer membrane protein [uncultured bacterium]|nr:MAG: outer membrane protein [uncultured bacterium]
MSVKKLIILAAAGLAVVGASAAMAGGPDHMAMPSAPAFEPSVYLEGHFGYAGSNWGDYNGSGVMGTAGSSAFSPSTNATGWLTAGADLGYNFTQNFALELGWFWLPNVSGGFTSWSSTASTNGGATVRSWFAYTAAKLSVPVIENLDLFGKIGVAYRNLSYSVPSTPAALQNVTGDGGYWAPLFGAGIQYDWNNWLIGAQYLYLPGNNSVNYGAPAPFNNSGAPNAAPEANLYTGFLGYKFNV